MDLQYALNWCMEYEATVYFHPSNPTVASGAITFGRVQVSVHKMAGHAQGAGGDSLPEAIEAWSRAYEETQPADPADSIKRVGFWWICPKCGAENALRRSAVKCCR